MGERAVDLVSVDMQCTPQPHTGWYPTGATEKPKMELLKQNSDVLEAFEHWFYMVWL